MGPLKKSQSKVVQRVCIFQLPSFFQENIIRPVVI